MNENLAVLERQQFICHTLFNIKNSDYVHNPYKYYAQVRNNSPVYKTPYGVYVLTRHADIISVLASKKLTKNYWRSIESIYGPTCYNEAGFCLISRWLTNLNAPEHTKLRKILVTALSNKELDYLQTLTTEIANQLIDSFYEQRSTDLIKTFAFKLPALIICRLLGIPEADFDFIFGHINMPNILLDPVYHSRATLDKANQSVNLLMDYFTELCRKRQNKLDNDLISLLWKANQEEKIALSEVELISNIFFLFGAGYETTMNFICNVIYVLFAHPSELQKLIDDLRKLPQAIEEVLRYESPVQVASPSHTTEDIFIDEYTIPKGEVIIPILGAANRDPAQYINPDQFDIDREPKKVLSFGSGIHLCLGSHLARIEVKVALECLLKRLPTLRIENIDKPKWKPHVGIRGLSELIARW